MSQKLEQFIRFGTDAAALERMLRMVQAITMVILASPLLRHVFTDLVGLGNAYVWQEPRSASKAVLTGLRGHVALARRFLRLFRFLESFNAAHKLYASLYAPPPPSGASGEKQPAPRHGGIPAETWLDILGKTFNGMYLLLETVNTVDALGVDGFSIWGAHWSPVLHVEAQRFWFLALVCGVAAGSTRLVKLFAYAPVPESGDGYGTGEKPEREKQEGENGGAATTDEKADWEKERERLRKIVMARREMRSKWRHNIRTKSRGLLRKLCADFLDLAVPGVVVGWVNVSSGTVGAVMIVTTYLTGLDIWERCGREVAAR